MVPLDVRLPVYPVFLATLYRFFGTSTRAILLAQVALDLLTCVLPALLAAQVVPEMSRRHAAIAALWLAATCPFVANYAAVALNEVLATLLIGAALVALARAYRLEEVAHAVRRMIEVLHAHGSGWPAACLPACVRWCGRKQRLAPADDQHRQSLPVLWVLYGKKPGLLFLIALATLVVARLVSFLVIVFFEGPFLGVVLVMRFVILAITHTYLVVLVFRIILGLSVVL